MLEEEDRRREFDIGSYGADIIERLNIEEAAATPPFTASVAIVHQFQDVVPSADKFEICRSFLATLQLANLGNVEIVQAPIAEQSAAYAPVGKRGSKAAIKAPASKVPAWSFSQAVVYDPELSQAEPTVGALAHRESRQLDVLAGFDAEALFQVSQESFKVILKSSDMRRNWIDEAEGHETASESIAQVSVAQVGRAAASLADASKRRKRAPQAKMQSTAKRAHSSSRSVASNLVMDSDDDDSEIEAVDDAEEGGRKVRAVTAPAPVPRPRGRSKGASAGAGARSNTDENAANAAPSPYKPGEFNSPLHKRVRKEVGDEEVDWVPTILPLGDSHVTNETDGDAVGADATGGATCGAAAATTPPSAHAPVAKAGTKRANSRDVRTRATS